MGTIKFIFCAILAVSGTLGFFYIKNRKKDKLALIFTISAILLKILGVILIQLFFPDLNRHSDAAIYYLPQVNSLLKGALPYIDFQTSYSFLFHFFLAPFVMIWNSVGVIALLMVIIDSGTILIYILFGNNKNNPLKWEIVFLYSLSPISVYWTMTGYNGVLIQFIILVSLILLTRDKSYLSGLVSIFGFLITKFLIVLFWPVLVFYKKKNIIKRLLPYLFLIVLLLGLWISGINILAPLEYEIGRKTSGNIWFLIETVFPSLSDNNFIPIISVISFIIIFLPLFIRFVHINFKNPVNSFDITSIFLSITFLLFMILSVKSYPFYFQMSLLFLIHSITREKDTIKKGVLSLMIIGALTTYEPHLYEQMASMGRGSVYFFLLVVIDSLLIASYVYLLLLCYRTLLKYKSSISAL